MQWRGRETGHNERIATDFLVQSQKKPDPFRDALH